MAMALCHLSELEDGFHGHALQSFSSTFTRQQNMQKNYQRTLNHLPDNTVEAWLFETSESRRQAERHYADKGHIIQLHSAYKTLVSTVLETGCLDNAKRVVIRYPVIAGDEPQRFLLECYPLSDLIAAKLTFEAFDCDMDNGLPFYEIQADDVVHQLPIPVRWVEKSTGERQLVACGWVKLADGSEQHVLTEFEAIYQEAYDYLTHLPIDVDNPPFFERLSLNIGLPVADQRLPVGEEHISLLEALHEDIYFSALEIFQHRLNLPSGDRTLMPGQVLPNVVYAETPSLHIHTHSINGDEHNQQHGCPELSSLGHWLSPAQINAHLQRLNGRHFEVMSRQGRVVQGCRVGNAGAPVKLAISGGQHANESSGVVGALRAAAELQHDENVTFTVCPSENVDGYAAFRELCGGNPRHMHHAARYTAAGNDLEYSDEYESQIRTCAFDAVCADVHVNLHGYPAHEWTRPLSGYVPANFAFYTIPKGFFLICRYHESHEALANTVLTAALEAIATHPEQMRVNQQMMQRYLAMNERPDFEIAHEVIPYVKSCRDDTQYPVEIITEAPDETIYGEDFRIAHESQYRVIMAIAKQLKTIAKPVIV